MGRVVLLIFIYLLIDGWGIVGETYNCSMITAWGDPGDLPFRVSLVYHIIQWSALVIPVCGNII